MADRVIKVRRGGALPPRHRDDPSAVALHPRKRTSSFSCPPAKAPRVSMAAASPLRRTESYIAIHRRRPSPTPPPSVRSLTRTTVRQATKPVPKSPLPLPPPHPTPSPRQSSPLSPARTPLPSRPLFPRSRPEPDLYRKALKTSMKGSPEGQKILRMGPHLAVSMMSATMELERIVARAASDDADPDPDAQGETDEDAEGDVVMHDVTTPQQQQLTMSWFPVDDWEMVDCPA
ncbi:hypothetical protein C0995_010017 [Termitomyces sp. Mi166|nr:hypothetical protein C0995_010017 [Termitomyces sp. Mi166\